MKVYCNDEFFITAGGGGGGGIEGHFFNINDTSTSFNFGGGGGGGIQFRYLTVSLMYEVLMTYAKLHLHGRCVNRIFWK
jgi:hypothetical protein